MGHISESESDIIRCSSKFARLETQTYPNLILSDGVEIRTCSCQYRPHILAHLDQRPHSKAANMSNVYTNTNTANMNASYQTTKSNMVKKGETCKKPASPVPAWPNDTRGEL